MESVPNTDIDVLIEDHEIEPVEASLGVEESLRFDDPYWDDAFGSWCDPTLRTCCS